MNPRSATLTRLMSVALLVAAAGSVGCETSRYQQVKDDATPNLDTLYQRPEDIDNSMVTTLDENGRMFWQDLGRAMLLDRPSRLTPEPIPVH